MNFNDLTREEIEIIKQHRKSKEILEIKVINTNQHYWDSYDSVKFSIKSDGIEINTGVYRLFPSGHQYAGQLNSGHGYFSTKIPKEEILKLKEFIDLYLN